MLKTVQKCENLRSPWYPPLSSNNNNFLGSTQSLKILRNQLKKVDYLFYKSNASVSGDIVLYTGLKNPAFSPESPTVPFGIFNMS